MSQTICPKPAGTKNQHIGTRSQHIGTSSQHIEPRPAIYTSPNQVDLQHSSHTHFRLSYSMLPSQQDTPFNAPLTTRYTIQAAMAKLISGNSLSMHRNSSGHLRQPFPEIIQRCHGCYREDSSEVLPELVLVSDVVDPVQ